MMTIWDVRARMGNRGHTEAGIARELGLSKQHINKVLKRERRSRRVEERLAQAAGLTYEQFLRRTGRPMPRHKAA